MSVAAKDIEKLEALRAAKTLTAQALSLAVRTIDEEDYPMSVGAHWLFHPQALYGASGWGRAIGYTRRCVEVFQEAGIDPKQFFLDHIDAAYFMHWALQVKEFLKLLPEVDRAELVAQAYLRHGSNHDRFVKACLEVDIPGDAIAKMLRARLLSVEVREGCSNDVDLFLEYGLKEDYNHLEKRYILPPDSPWGMFSDEELRALLLQLAAKSPTVTLRYQKKIEIRLGREVMVDICSEAAKHLSSLRCLELGHLAVLTLEEKGRILLRVKPDFNNTTVLAGLAAELVFADIIQVETSTGREILENIPGYTLFLTALRLTDKNADLRAAWEKQREYFYDRLHNAGFAAGVVEKDVFKHKTRGQTIQWIVQVDEKKYVHDDGDHRWFPSEGDRVVLSTKSAKALTPFVYVTYFTPVDKEVR